MKSFPHGVVRVRLALILLGPEALYFATLNLTGKKFSFARYFCYLISISLERLKSRSFEKDLLDTISGIVEEDPAPKIDNNEFTFERKIAMELLTTWKGLLATPHFSNEVGPFVSLFGPIKNFQVSLFTAAHMLGRQV